MFAKLPMFQRQGKTAFKKDLTNIIALSEHLNYPEKKFKSIHVAGTNGKGSTSHLIASVLHEAGYKVGLYTSPHLKDFRERIRINGNPISENDVVEFIDSNKEFLENQGLSFFEMTVGLAFDYFAMQKVDIAIVEVGLGGRLDSTNIITPLVSVITNIGFDHTQFLGESLQEIAFEKAGIIKPNIPVVLGENKEETTTVFRDIAKKNNTKLIFAEEMVNKNYSTDLLGDYQKENVKTAVQTIRLISPDHLHISEKELVRGLQNVVKNTDLKGRWQILGVNPKIICDVAHNKEGLIQIMRQLKRETYNNLHVVLGMVNDKNLDSILPLFPKRAKYYFCKPNIPRGLNAKELKQKALQFQLIGNAYETVNLAFQAAKQKAGKKDLIYVGGSTFVIAELPL
jgi:dihydrofolate synthase / folylpolyglutamate synthase